MSKTIIPHTEVTGGYVSNTDGSFVPYNNNWSRTDYIAIDSNYPVHIVNTMATSSAVASNFNATYDANHNFLSAFTMYAGDHSYTFNSNVKYIALSGLTTLFPLELYTNIYVPQLTAYSPDNLYTSPYYQGVQGGYYAMPNCTRYCYGRWWSLMGSQPSGLSGLGNAEDWWSNCTAYQKGQTPKLGAIACFADGPYSGLGHVAIVEKIYSDGKVLFSNSAYRGQMFYLRCGSPANNYHDGGHSKPGYESAYVFQGFIYFPEDFDPEVDPTPDPGPGPPEPDYGMNPLIRYYAKKQIYRNQGRGSVINYI